jgi:glycosyltransferase involved in cell wall biosynthesis
MIKSSIIISVYKKIHDLDLILTALKVQSCSDFEVIIADDGSGERMQIFVHDFIKNSPYKIFFLTQNDNGFRKNKILNKAIISASSPYLIFIDGDCIPHFDFVKHHLDNKHKNTVLCGKRVNLSKKLSSEITKTGLLNKQLQKVRFRHFYDSFLNKEDRTTYAEHGIILENKFLRKMVEPGEPHIVGCNFSLHKELIEKINGFDENYIGPGIGEDSDIEFRLRLINAKFRSLKNLAILFHLHHRRTAEEKQNYIYFDEVKNRREPVCRNGIIKYQ